MIPCWRRTPRRGCGRRGRISAGFERCLTDEPPDVEDALFHCQQAAEKALKAFLIWHDRPFKKTHDLAALGSQCKGIDNSLDLLIDRLDDLSQYAWAYRYPTSLTEPPAPKWTRRVPWPI